jgi:hypothetical protein
LIILIISFLTIQYVFFQFRKPNSYNGLCRIPEESFPLYFDQNRSHNYEGFNISKGIGNRLYCYTEFHFFDNKNGGMTGSRVVLFDFFHPEKNYPEIIIIHHFFIIAEYEFSVLEENNGSWEIT